jgi:hypothetical protein
VDFWCITVDYSVRIRHKCSQCKAGGLFLTLFAIATFTYLDVLTAPAAPLPGPASAPAGHILVRATPATRLAVSVRKFRETDHELEQHRHADDVDALRQ